MLNFSDTKQNLAVSGVEIFRVGEHRPMAGPTILFSTSMLNDVVASYEPDKHNAPVVIGHPKTDAPAYGWVSKLRLEGDTLVADFSDIDPEFARLVKSKRYRKISASFWKPSTEANPHGNKWALKHVGFLGATAPAVKGLKEASFAAGQSGVLVFGENDTFDLPLEHMRTIQHHENRAIIEGLVSQGRVLPYHQEQLLDFTDALDNSDAVSFSDGSEHGRRDWLFKFLSEMPSVVSYGQIDMAEAEGVANSSTNTPLGYSVDPDGQVLHSRATALAKTENITFEEAVVRVANKG